MSYLQAFYNWINTYNVRIGDIAYPYRFPTVLDESFYRNFPVLTYDGTSGSFYCIGGAMENLTHTRTTGKISQLTDDGRVVIIHGSGLSYSWPFFVLTLVKEFKLGSSVNYIHRKITKAGIIVTDGKLFYIIDEENVISNPFKEITEELIKNSLPHGYTLEI
jgi:hypothetical protein